MIAILMQVESLSKYFFNFEILKPRNDVPQSFDALINLGNLHRLSMLPIDGQSLATRSKLFYQYFRISELKETRHLDNLEYLQNQGFFTSTYAAQFVENYYNKDEKNSNQ